MLSKACVLIESRLKENQRASRVVDTDTASVRMSSARNTHWHWGDNEGKEEEWSIELKLNSNRAAGCMRPGLDSQWENKFRPQFPDNGNYFPGLTRGPNLLHSQLMLATRIRWCMFLWWEIALEELVLYFSSVQASPVGTLLKDDWTANLIIRGWEKLRDYQPYLTNQWEDLSPSGQSGPEAGDQMHIEEKRNEGMMQCDRRDRRGVAQ